MEPSQPASHSQCVTEVEAVGPCELAGQASQATEDDGAALGATNALAARLKAVEERREREADAEARRVAEDVAALRRARRAADRRAAEAEAARLAAEALREETAVRRDVIEALHRRVEELERELAMRGGPPILAFMRAVQEV